MTDFYGFARQLGKSFHIWHKMLEILESEPEKKVIISVPPRYGRRFYMRLAEQMTEILKSGDQTEFNNFIAGLERSNNGINSKTSKASSGSAKTSKKSKKK